MQRHVEASELCVSAWGARMRGGGWPAGEPYAPTAHVARSIKNALLFKARDNDGWI